MNRITLNKKTYRLIPSHFPPIKLFEDLLEPSDLDAAYELEGLTNPRLQDEVGNIRLVHPEDRIVGQGTTAIMAAFTHIGYPSRFTDGTFGIYYAGLDLATAIKESTYSRERFLASTSEKPQVITMRCYSAKVASTLIDARNNDHFHDTDDYSLPQSFGKKLKAQKELGLLYRSVRKKGGECIAILRPNAMVPPAIHSEHYQYWWNGNKIEHVLKVSASL